MGRKKSKKAHDESLVVPGSRWTSLRRGATGKVVRVDRVGENDYKHGGEYKKAPCVFYTFEQSKRSTRMPLRRFCMHSSHSGPLPDAATPTALSDNKLAVRIERLQKSVDRLIDSDVGDLLNEMRDLVDELRKARGVDKDDPTKPLRRNEP